MKALVVSTNTRHVRHVQGCCIVALINVNLVEQSRGFNGGIGKGYNIEKFKCCLKKIK
jgi:hypothetical protein